MQDDLQYPQTSNLNQRVVNYRPERPGQEFQRVNAAVAAPLVPGLVAQPVQVVATPTPVISAPTVGVTTPVNDTPSTKAPFTLGKAIIVFVAIMIVVVGGYIAFATWLA